MYENKGSDKKKPKIGVEQIEGNSSTTIYTPLGT
jgi:hypothetical protein